MASVLLEHVSKSYGNQEVVKDVNLDIQDKEFLVLLGPSGCGKTTTLRMIAGLESLSKGRIRIAGRDVSDVPPKDRDIAMVFQNYALYPHMTVFDNIAFGLRMRRVPREEVRRRVEAAAEILGIAPYLHRRPKELSGGQRQRVALGRAIVRQPAAFLMDEPLSNLDAKLRAQTRIELKRLHEEIGGTIIYVTHDQVEAMTMGTRIVVMRDGVVQQVDTPEGIYRNPVNMFVATFVGTPAMNMLRADLMWEEGLPLFVVEGQRIRGSRRLATLLRGYVGSSVILGVRPEDLHVDAHVLAEHPEAVLRGQVGVIEPLGHEKVLTVHIGSSVVTIRTGNEWSGARGEDTQIAVDMERLIVFDPATEQALRGEGA